MLMKLIILIFILFSSATPAIAQYPDSSSYSLSPDQELMKEVPDIVLYDTSGKKVKLSSFKSKTLYLDFWSTTCTPCIKMFPYEHQLQQRLKKLSLDTSVLIIKVCAGSPVEDWKSMVR